MDSVPDLTRQLTIWPGWIWSNKMYKNIQYFDRIQFHSRFKLYWTGLSCTELYYRQNFNPLELEQVRRESEEAELHETFNTCLTEGIVSRVL